ncbi:helix-turn-helix domain-containing protein [Candidatus Aerophobetes bacterium]|nr:helix-turn-helix domain-containing protein [Candidatus Aerophobetes bacterium]
MEINSNVIIQNLTPKAKKRHKRLWGVDFEGKKGKIVKVLINSRGEKQGYRVRFPEIKIAVNENGGISSRENFEYPFYNSEVALLENEEELVFPIPGDNGERKRRTRRGRKESIKVVKRLRQEGHKVNELAKRFEVSRQTISQWLNG